MRIYLVDDNNKIYEGNIVSLREKDSIRADLEENIKKSKRVENIVKADLKEMGIHSYITGFTYLVDSIKMVYKNKLKYVSVTKEIYPQIAKKYKVTASSVERAIRHAIESSWKNADKEFFKTFFENSIRENKRPSNYYFIFVMAERLKNQVDKSM